MLTSVFNKLKFAPNKIRREIVKRNPLLQFISNFAYEAALKRHSDYLPALSKTDHYLVECLRQEGVYITSLEKLSIPSCRWHQKFNARITSNFGQGYKICH